MAQTYSFTVLGTSSADLLSTAIATALEPTLVKGFDGDDVIIGYGPLDRLEGGLGNDIITAAGGTVLGGAGNDVITAEIAADIVIRDGAGSDEVLFQIGRAHV